MKLGKEAKKQFVSLITGAFAFAAALQWKEAIMEWLKPVISKDGGAMTLTWVAILVTVIALIVTVTVTQLVSEEE